MKDKKIGSILKNFASSKNKKIFGTFLALFSIMSIIAFVSYLLDWQTDDSIVSSNSFNPIEDKTQNLIGGIGAKFSNRLVKDLFGISALIIPFVSLIVSLRILGYKLLNISKLVYNSMLALIFIPITLNHFFKFEILAGGTGIFCKIYLTNLIGSVGTSLLLVTTFILFIVLSFKITNKSISAFFKKIIPKKDDLETNTIEGKNTIQEPTEDLSNEKNEILTDNKVDSSLQIDEMSENNISDKKVDSKNIELKTIENDEENILDDNDINKKLKELGDFDPTLELSKYEMPKPLLLKDYGNSKIEIDKNELEKNKNKIVETLGHYKIGITSISATIGPTITLYEIVPDAGVRISKIKNLEDDISLSLAAEGIRIIAPIPGRGTIGIEVPNVNKNTVSMLEVLKSEKFQNSEMELPIAFGKTISNETFVIDLAKMPHLLMAGATGQGKSVGLNAMLVSLLYKKHPSQIKFVLVDPKKVELTLYNKIERHFLAKLPDAEDAIITDTKKVVNTVNSLCIEMDQRYELCKLANCRNIKEYNKKFISRRLNPNDGHRFMPYIVLVIDEFADLIMTAGKEIETPIARLAQLARAIGIHLIVATQRPSVNVITGLIKANFPARVAFRVTSSVDSRTIMDTKGAEQLIGMGDMLISTGNEITRLQCAFIDTPEVEKICEFIGSQRAYPDAHILPEFEGETEGSGTKADLDDRDDMFDQAALLVVKHQSGSTSLIQRKLRLGYNRAGRIIDQLEAAEIVGPFEGSKARKVLIKDEVTLDEILNKIKSNE
tara:strand:- start:2571 stop:4907 length:2337 start_codon:yes stop_codon:yes gene_type:complete